MSPFVRFCKDDEPHTGHAYIKHWCLVDLPLLREPERYPAEWDSTYRCPGLKRPGETWAESLGIVVPDSAPGGQPIGRPLSSFRGSGQNRANIEYDGFFDTDAYGRS